ncbi:hypothetical protein [Cryobacterium sp. TMT1-66-1]|uniref:hypothetical protein n=1 Tax=Cryobacterium sp. TMT1-66-1 TaxID=1259242 RepID=UPI00106AE571|nr:hypothetical protein [Cryobacterium sp. TMT1-66-1]TFD04153.1 hypothetical protein E3T29_15985 [Cryobacterium sp. TMT1-66-1]
MLTAVTIRTVMRQCWAPQCGKWLSLWAVDNVTLESRRSRVATLHAVYGYLPWQAARFEQRVQETVRTQIMASDRPAPAVFERRHSKLAGTFYIGQVCPHCHVVQGDGHIGSTYDWERYRIPLREKLIFPETLLVAPHLCEDHGRGRCSQVPRPDGGRNFKVETFGWAVVSANDVNGEADPLPAKRGRR